MPPENQPSAGAIKLPDWVYSAIQEWSELDAWVKKRADDPKADKATPDSRFVQAKEERKELRIKIAQYLENHPNKTSDAVAAGFTWKGLEGGDDDNSGQDGSSDGGDPNKNKNQPGGNNQPGGGNGGGGGGGGGGGNATSGIPGVQGKDYKVVRLPNGQLRAVYKLNFAGNNVSVSIALPSDKNKLEGLGIKTGNIDHLTAAQAKKLEYLGKWDEFDFKVNDPHPFAGIKRTLMREYKGVEYVLGNDELMGVLIAAQAGNWSYAEKQGAIHATDWYQSATRYQRDWMLNYSDKDRKRAIEGTKGKLVNALEDLYGLDWVKHIDGGMAQVREWSEKIASGALGNPSGDIEGFNLWLRRQEDRAANITGTPAAIAAANEQAQIAKSDPAYQEEDLFEALRQQSIEWLGYKAKPDQDTLQKWAKKLVAGTHTQADYDQWLRNMKQQLFPYLDPDTPWQQFAGSYKSIAEELLGREVSWEDKMLADLTKVNAKGEFVPDQAMSFNDFERKVRETDRYWNSKDAQDKGFQLLNFLTNTFTGAA